MITLKPGKFYFHSVPKEDFMTDIERLSKEMTESYKKSNVTMFSNDLALPSRSEVIGILSDIRKLFFPAYFDAEELSLGEENFIKSLLSSIHEKVRRQVSLAMSFNGNGQNTNKTDAVTDDFMNSLPSVHAMLLKDIDATFEGDPAAQSKEEIIFSYPGFYAIFVYRIAHLLYIHKVPFVARMMTEHAHGKTGIDINPGATIGDYFFIDHGTGIVIGETTTIGSHVKLYQGVTLGALSPRKGQMLSGVKRHPTVCDNVTIYSGASILGGDTVIGEGAVIGGNSFITESVAAGARVSSKLPELIIK